MIISIFGSVVCLLSPALLFAAYQDPQVLAQASSTPQCAGEFREVVAHYQREPKPTAPVARQCALLTGRQ
jgi:hypothetical protein